MSHTWVKNPTVLPRCSSQLHTPGIGWQVRCITSTLTSLWHDCRKSPCSAACFPTVELCEKIVVKSLGNPKPTKQINLKLERQDLNPWFGAGVEHGPSWARWLWVIEKGGWSRNCANILQRILQFRCTCLCLEVPKRRSKSTIKQLKTLGEILYFIGKLRTLFSDSGHAAIRSWCLLPWMHTWYVYSYFMLFHYISLYLIAYTD
jgi:hypothetical protein